MNFITLGFALFALVVWAVYMALPHRMRGYWMLAASMIYFLSQGFSALVLVGLMIAWSWLWSLAISRLKSKKPAVGIAVAGLLLILVLGKYSNWISSLVMGFAPSIGVLGASVPSWLGPLGISYFVFRMISYLADVGMGKISPGGPFSIAGYVLFFPTLPAGPIERYDDFNRQFQNKPGPAWEDIRCGAMRLAGGLFKKVVISDMLWELGKLLRYPDDLPTCWLWLAMYAYTFHIYIDFSGYSDMAIGISRMFGIRIRENFDWPYKRTNIRDFWRNWHMSLTSFITEYIYFPLGGNRQGLNRAGLNTMIAMGLCGMWHGAGWHFLGWGLYHGAGLTVYRMWRIAREKRGWHRPESVLRRYAAWFATFHFVALGWVLFLLPAKKAVVTYLALFGIKGVIIP